MKKNKVFCKYYFVLIFLLTFVYCSAPDTVKTVDVLVVGGSTSGTSAGIVAARLGVTTLIVEESPMLGGMFTAQGVGACDGNHNLPSGIWNEFREKLRSHYGGAAALATGWVSHTQFEPSVGDSIFKALADAEPKLEVVHGYYYSKILRENDVIIGAEFLNEAGNKLIVFAKQTIDATDIGETLKDAGANYRLGMDAKSETGEANAPEQANQIVQDLTWVAILKDYGSNADKTIAKPAGYNAENFKGCCDKTVDGLIINCDKMLTYGKLPNNKYMINWPKKGNDIYLNVVEMSRSDRNKALEEAKNYTLQFVYYIQTELGFKHLGLADDEFATKDLLAYSPYHREGRRLKGLAYLTYNHVAQPYNQLDALYRTGISVGDYPVDHHHEQNPNAPDIGFPPVPSFNIPLGSLIPETLDGLIVSDKAISVTNLINGSTRLQPVVLLTGQAAGTLAALSVLENKPARAVSVRTVQQKLLDQNVYLMPLFDVPVDHPSFQIIQKVASTGIIATKGEAFQWANRTWFYPDSTITEKEFVNGLKQFFPNQNLKSTDKILTIARAEELIEQVRGTALGGYVLIDRHKAIKRDQLAYFIDEWLKPFEIKINHKGMPE